jgi:hypothetical protein
MNRREKRGEKSSTNATPKEKREVMHSFPDALSQQRAPEKNFDHDDPLFVLVLESGVTSVGFHEALALDAAILLNLWRMGDLTRTELETELTKSNPEKAPAWLKSFAAA